MKLKLPLIPGWSAIRVPCITNKEFKKKVKEIKDKKGNKDDLHQPTPRNSCSNNQAKER